MKYLAIIEPVKAKGLRELVEQIKLFASQLNRISVKPSLNTHEMIDEGLAVSYEELCAKVHHHSTSLLERLRGDGELNLEAALAVQDCLLICLMTMIPAQRTPIYTSLQIAARLEDIRRPESNYIVFSPGMMNHMSHEHFFFILTTCMAGWQPPRCGACTSTSTSATRCIESRPSTLSKTLS